MLDRHLLSWPLPWLLLLWPVEPAKEEDIALTAISSNKLTGVPNPESQFDGLKVGLGTPEEPWVVITVLSSTLVPEQPLPPLLLVAESDECFLTASNFGLRFILALKWRCWALRLWVHCRGAAGPEVEVLLPLGAVFSSLLLAAMSGMDKWKRLRASPPAKDDLLLIGVAKPIPGGLAAILGGEVTKKLECRATLWGTAWGLLMMLEWG